MIENVNCRKGNSQRKNENKIFYIVIINKALKCLLHKVLWKIERKKEQIDRKKIARGNE